MRKLNVKLIPLVGALAGVFITPICLGQVIPQNEASSSQWSQIEIKNVVAKDKPVLCGKQKIIIPLDSGIRIVNLKTRQSSDLSIRKTHALPSCSGDGRYLFVSGIDKTGSYNLSYFDLQTGLEYFVFEGLKGIRSDRVVQLVSPNADYVIGPNGIGSKISLPEGRALAVIPATNFEKVIAPCGITWSTDGLKLIVVQLHLPQTKPGFFKTSVTFRFFDVPKGAWTEASSDYLPVSAVDGNCPSIYAYRERSFLLAESTRKAPTGHNDAFEFSVDGKKLRVKQAWENLSDFALGGDGTIAYSRIHGITYLPEGNELTAGGDVSFEVFLETKNNRNLLTKSTIPKVMDKTSFDYGSRRVGVDINSIDGAAVVIDGFHQDDGVVAFIRRAY